jgi:hypothetical protein
MSTRYNLVSAHRMPANSLPSIETGAFETDADEIAASHRLLARNPEAQIWFRLVGAPYTRRFGPRSRTAA